MSCLWIYGSAVQSVQFGPNLADCGHTCSFAYSQLEEGGRNRVGWSRMASAHNQGESGDSLWWSVFTQQTSLTGSTEQQGSERGRKLARLRTATCHFCHFLLDRTSYKTRPNSREEKTDFSPWTLLDKDELWSYITEGYGWKEEQRIMPTFTIFHRAKWNRITSASPSSLFCPCNWINVYLPFLPFHCRSSPSPSR